MSRLLSEDRDYLQRVVQALVEATLEAEMTVVLNVQKSERTDERRGYRAGNCTRLTRSWKPLRAVRWRRPIPT